MTETNFALIGAKVREDIAREASDSQKYEEVVFNPLSDREAEEED